MNNLLNTEEQEVNLIEIDRKEWIDKRHALERLFENPDFELVVLKGYFQERAINGVSMLANRGVIRNGERGDLIEELVGISRLQDYFITIRNLGAESDESEADLD